MQNQAKTPARISLSPTVSMIVCALFIGLTFIFTSAFHVPLAVHGGLVHFGNVPLLVAAILFGKKLGAVSGLGMVLFNLVHAHLTMWAPFTLVISAVMGFAVGLVMGRRQTLPYFILAMALAALIRVSGFYFAGVILLGNWIVPLEAMIPNFAQILLAAPIVWIIIKPLRPGIEKIFGGRENDL